MNSGVEILLQRLKDNPEYFGVDPSMYGSNHQNKWSPFLSEVLNTEYFTDEEKQAVRTAFNDARRENFTERIMKALTGEDEVSEMGKPVRITSTNPYHSGSVPLGMTTSTGQSTVSLNTGAGVGGMSAVSGTISNGGTWGTTSVSTIGDQLRAYNAQLEAQYDLVKAQKDLAKKEKKHKTIFGKLFNYT